MTQKPGTLPLWILIISGLFALMEIGVSISYIVAPESVLENVDLHAKGVTYLIQMWAARQFALGFIFGYAVFKRSAPMLKVAYIFFFIMFIGDFLIGIGMKDPALYGAAVIMCLIAAVMIYFINKKSKVSEDESLIQDRATLPAWILIVSGLFALLGLAVSASLVFAPASVLPNVNLQAKGVSYLIQMWAARQFALGFIFGYAVFRRSAAMLTLAWLFFLVMNIGDFFIGIGLKDASLYGGAGVMCLISSVMIYFINRKAEAVGLN
jgi:hypothetical membrane protein